MQAFPLPAEEAQERPLPPEARLAAAVLLQAMHDAQDAHLPEVVRSDARWFLAGGGTLPVLAQVLGVEPERLSWLARRAVSA